MRKVVFLVLSVILIISLFAIPAYAADGNVTIEVTADKSEVHPGDTITYTFTLKHSRADGVSAVEFGVGSFPSGVTQGSAVFDQAAKDAFKGLNGQGAPTFNSNNGHYVFTAASGVTTPEIKLMTLTCTVDKTAAVNQAFAPTISALSAVGGDNQQATAGPSTNGASVTVTHTDDLHHDWQAGDVTDATCTAPKSTHYTCKTSGCQAVKDVPEGAARGHNLSATFNWDGTTAESAKVTATVTCSNGTGCDYASGKTFTQDAPELTVERVETENAKCGDTITVTYTAKLSVSDGKGGTWSPEGTQTHTVENGKKMHDWDDATFEWSLDDPAKLSATATRTCKNGCGKVDTVTVTPTKVDAECVAPKCETEGTDVYTATFDFATTDNASLTTEAQKVSRTEKESKTVPATGHKWPAANAEGDEFVWDDADLAFGDIPTATFTVKCQNAGCDKEYNTKGLTLTAEVVQAKDPAPKAPTCTEEGSAAFTAKVSTGSKSSGSEKAVEYTATKEETYAATGHKWGAPQIEWTEDKNAADPEGKWTAKAVWTCQNDEKDKHEETAEVTYELTAATYTEAGEHKYTAEATFNAPATDTIADADKKASAVKSEEIKMLEPKVSADVTVPEGVEAGGAKDALASQMDAAVDAALAGKAPAWMPKDVADAIQAANKVENKDEKLTVSTKLVVADAENPTDIAGVDAKNVLDAYDITIQVIVEGEEQNETAYITQTPEAISFTVPVPAKGGPIFYVMTDHGGTWTKIDSKVDGENIVFSSKQFSQFAVIGSDDIANANVTVDPEYAYTGAVIRPVVKVTVNGGATELKEGVDYEVVVTGDAVEPGDYKVTIKGIGSYTGSVEKIFTILAPVPTATPAPTETPAPTDTPAPTAAATKAPTATKDPNAAPATGDETPVVLYVTALTVCAAALALVLVFRRRREK